MRRAFVAALCDLAERDERVLLLTGDLGYSVVEPFADRFPDRFLNMGVAEQNMIAVATGLAEAGYRPYAYSIATFAALRPYEFVRNGPVAHRLPVRIVGVGGGFDYGHNGRTHYALEDIALMRVQPEMVVVAPADWQQAKAAVAATADVEAPLYLRLGRDESTVVPGLDGRFELGRATRVCDGADVLLVATGAAAADAVGAAALLAADGVGAAVVVVASLAPTPKDDLLRALREFPLALAVEPHYVHGGLGSLVCELVAENAVACRVIRCGVRALPDARSGEDVYLKRLHGLDAAGLAAAARDGLT